MILLLEFLPVLMQCTFLDTTSTLRLRFAAPTMGLPRSRSRRLMRYRRDVSAGIIVFHRSPEGCRFLLLLSRLTKRPLWEFPKGGVDEGETVLQAALRELQEETGLEPGDVSMCE